ncbi:protein FAM177A1 [Hypomesus transpacificus]|uniref:protein FAM177A1 n=1 Tax=Hypomesus transpacificus TaxID=137520 RepID=UPI001F0744E1|nr:protein FAM177A1 [Hypomesus transpacificus]
MNNNLQEGVDVQETEFGGPSLSKERRVIHFSSGETLEEEGSEEEEGGNDQPAFTELANTSKFSWRTVARMSLQTCDFLGGKLAGVLGLNAAKYQYAIDEFCRDSKPADRNPDEASPKDRAEKVHLAPRNSVAYGTTGPPAFLGPPAPREHSGNTSGESLNTGYQEDHEQ